MTRYLAPIALLGSIAVFSFSAELSPLAVGVVLLMFVAMAMPGVALLRRVLPNESSTLVILVVGTVLGLAVSRFGLAAVSLALGPGFGGVILLLLGLAVASAVVLVRSGLPKWTQEDQHEGGWLAAIIAVEFIAMAAAYSAVGRPTPEGFAFTPYFDRDYMNHLAVTAELAREAPPENPYFAGERLHYYWGFHLWPAAVKSLAGVTAREAMTACLPPTVALFIASLLLWGRRFLQLRTAGLVAVALGLFAFSYIGLLLLAKLTVPTIFQRTDDRLCEQLSHSSRIRGVATSSTSRRLSRL